MTRLFFAPLIRGEASALFASGGLLFGAREAKPPGPSGHPPYQGGKTSAGFTLIELVITVAIVAILASVAMPLNELVLKRAKEQDLRRALRDIREAIDTYKQLADEGRIEKKVGESGYPRNLLQLVEGVEDKKDPKKARIYLLRRLPPDPFAADSWTAPAETWGLRSYASPPDDPSEGDDVFDVFSRSEKLGINGRPYKEW